MRLAIVEALAAGREGNAPIGSVITRNRRIVERGHDQVFTRHDVTAHAEVVSVRSKPDSVADCSDAGLDATLEIARGSSILPRHFAEPNHLGEIRSFALWMEMLLRTRLVVLCAGLLVRTLELTNHFWFENSHAFDTPSLGDACNFEHSPNFLLDFFRRPFVFFADQGDYRDSSRGPHPLWAQR